jgi:hypothetical protein
MAAAAAERAVGIHLDVAELSGHTIGAAQQPPVGEDAGPNAFGDVDHDEVADAIAIAEPDFGQGAGVGDIVHFDTKAGGTLDARFDAQYRPVEVGREDELFEKRICAARQTDADAIEGLVAMRLDELANGGHKRLNRLVGVGRQVDDILCDDLAAEIGDGDGALGRMNVESNDSALVVELQKGGAAATREATCRTFENPLLFDEVFDDQGYRAALQAGDASEIGSRKRLARADEIEDEIPIDLARCFIGRTLPSSESKSLRLRSRHLLAFRSEAMSAKRQPEVFQNRMIATAMPCLAGD